MTLGLRKFLTNMLLVPPAPQPGIELKSPPPPTLQVIVPDSRLLSDDIWVERLEKSDSSVLLKNYCQTTNKLGLSYQGSSFPGSSNIKESICNSGDLGWEDPLEKGMAIPSSILAWRIPMDGGYKSMGSQRVSYNRVIFTFTLSR